jgi:6-phosphogluconate dehydrogenase
MPACCDFSRSERGSPSLLPVQRDCFGAHTCERRDEPRGGFFHTHWAGTGGRVASSTYTV